MQDNKLMILKSISKGAEIVQKYPAMYLVSAVFSFISSIFMFFTILFYQPDEATDFFAYITGIFSPSEYIVFSLFYICAYLLTFAVLVKMSTDNINMKSDIFSALAFSASIFFPYLLLMVLSFLIHAFGFLLLIVPGLYLFAKLFFSPLFMIVDNKGVFDSLRSSWELSKGNSLRIIALYLLLSSVISIISFLTVEMPRMQVAIIYFVAQLFFMPWFCASITVAFEQLKKRSDNLKA